MRGFLACLVVINVISECYLRASPYYRKTLYEILKIFSNCFAIFMEIGRLPHSIADIQFCVIPSFSASSCCVHSIFPRNPRRAIAGEASLKTSSALTISSPSEFTSLTLNPVKTNIPLMVSATALALVAGTEREIIACPAFVGRSCISACILSPLFETAIVHTAVWPNILNFYNLNFSIGDFPYSDITWATAV